jgi:hypothetical protein
MFVEPKAVESLTTRSTFQLWFENFSLARSMPKPTNGTEVLLIAFTRGKANNLTPKTAENKSRKTQARFRLRRDHGEQRFFGNNKKANRSASSCCSPFVRGSFSWLFCVASGRDSVWITAQHKAERSEEK